MDNDKEDNASEASQAADLPSQSWLWVVVEIWKFSPYFTFQGKLLKIGMPDKGENVLEMSRTMLQRVSIESMCRFYVWAQDNIVSPINFLIYSPICVTNGHDTWPCHLWTTSTLYYIPISFSSKGTIQKIYSVLHNNLLIIFHLYYTYPLLFL